MANDRLGQLRRDGGVLALGARTRIRVTGADRVRYLNGQTSNDLRRLGPGVAMPSLVLTAKGKLCACVYVWMDGDALVVDSDGGLGEVLLARLERYAISDDVNFELVECPPEACHRFGLNLPEGDGVRVSRLGVEGIDLPERPDDVLMATPEEVDILRIERGVPLWGRELGEDTLPQEVGLERTAVDFHKGCYVGQEVVSRIASVGRVNRELAGLVGDFDPTRVVGLQTESGERAGTVTSAIFHPQLSRTIALGMLSSRVGGTRFVAVDESGACLGGLERSEFPLVS